MLALLAFAIMDCPFKTYPAEILNKIPVPNPSARVKEATASASVSEAAAIYSAGGGLLLLEKQKEVWVKATNILSLLLWTNRFAGRDISR